MYRPFLWALVLAFPVPAWGAVSVSPPYAQLVPGQSLTFSAPGGGSVIWQVDNAVGGAAASGTISPSGVYTAPASLPDPAAVTVTAVSVSDPSETTTATVTLLAQAPSGQTYFVATAGSDSNPGTMAAPFATLQHASSIATAGDTVFVRQGIYNALFTQARSGDTTHGPITFASYPGELATLDGTGLAIPGGQNGLVTLVDVSDVIVQGFEIRNYTTASRKQVPVGIYVTGAGTGVQIVGNHIHDIATTAKTNPKQCGSNALGLAVYGSRAPASVSALVVSGNEIDHLHTGCSESMSLDGNVDGFVVMGNVVHDNDNIGIDAIGFERVSPDPTYDQARNGEIRGNTVYDIKSYGNPDYGRQYAADGIYVDGGTQIVIEQNRVYAADLGIELASEHKGRLTSYVIARNNLVYGDTSNGISIGGYGRARGGSDHITIVNNTLFGNDTKNTGSGEFQIQYHATNNVFENNIVYAGKQSLFVHDYAKDEPAPAALDHDLYFATEGAAAAHFRWKGVAITGFPKYQAASGQDAHTAFADPLFVDLLAPDLDLQAGSPAFGMGNNLGESVIGATDFVGNPRVAGGLVTIGAYQQ